MTTLAVLRQQTGALSQWRDGVFKSRDGLAAIRSNIDTGISQLRSIPEVKDQTTAEHIRVLIGKGDALLAQNSLIGPDIERWATRFTALDNDVKRNPKWLFLRQADPSWFARAGGADTTLVTGSIRGKELVEELAAKVAGLVGDAKAIKLRATVHSRNVNTFSGEAVDAQNKASGGGILRKIENVAGLPGRIVGGTVESIVGPIKGTLIAVAIGAAAIAALWFLGPMVFGKRKAEAVAALAGDDD